MTFYAYSWLHDQYHRLSVGKKVLFLMVCPNYPDLAHVQTRFSFRLYYWNMKEIL